MKIVKITNTEWLEREEQIYRAIEDFSRKVHVDGIHISTYATFVRQAVWFGGNTHEFWCVFDDSNNVVGMGHWFVLGLPHVAKVYCQALYAWASGPKTKHKTIEMLVDEFQKFGAKHNAVWYAADFINKQVANIFIKYAARVGYEARETGITNVIMRRKLK